MLQINTLHHATDSLWFAGGETICTQGQAGDVMYLITAGEVDIVIDDACIATLGAGSIVGEMALIDGLPRSATVIARGDCALYPIGKQHFDFLIRQAPSFATQIMQILIERLHDAQERRAAAAGGPAATSAQHPRLRWAPASAGGGSSMQWAAENAKQ